MKIIGLSYVIMRSWLTHARVDSFVVLSNLLDLHAALGGDGDLAVARSSLPRVEENTPVSPGDLWLVVMSHWTADLHCGSLVHCRLSANLQLDCSLCRVWLEKPLGQLGLDLGVGDIFALLSVALLLHPGPHQRGDTGGIRPVDHLTEGEKLLTPDLPEPPASPTAAGALGPGRRLPGGRAVKDGTELLGLGGRLWAGRVLQLDDVVVAVRHLLYALNTPALAASATALRAGGEVRDVPARRTGVLVAGPDLNLQSLPGLAEVGRHGALLGGLHADHDGLLQSSQAGGGAGGEPRDLPDITGAGLRLAKQVWLERKSLRRGRGESGEGLTEDLTPLVSHDLLPPGGGTVGRLHAQLSLGGLEARALLVRQGGHSAGELHEDLTLHLPEPHTLPTAGATGAPIVNNEAEISTVRTLIMWEEGKD